MPTAVKCPDDNTLQQLLLGTLAQGPVEELSEHLLACTSCAARAGKLSPADELTQSLRQLQTLPPDEADPLVARLRSKLHELRQQPRAPAQEDGATQSLSLPTQSSSPGEPHSDPAAAQGTTFDFLAPPQQADEIGRLGSYRILNVLGQGGMGVVFQAEDPRLGRLCAIKAMLPEVAKRPGMKERFLREARSAAQIEHDNIIPIFQVDEDRGAPFIAMPFLKGMSLEDWLRKKQKDGKATPVTAAEALKVGRQIAKGLAAAHERGMIHRDIKPANVWLDASAGGRVKILDFGLARLEETVGAQHLTQSGVILGTPAYMAPEQAKGLKLDGRADLFSLGVILYRLCTGALPFRGTYTLSTLLALATQTPPAPHVQNPAIPQPLSDLVMKLLEKEPKDRVSSAKEAARLLQALEKSLAGGDSGMAPSQSAPSLPLADLPKIDPSVPKVAAPGPKVNAPAAAIRGEPTPAAAKSIVSRLRPTRKLLIAFAAFDVVLLLAGIVVYWQLPGGGTVRIEINDDAMTAEIDKNGMLIKKGDEKPIELKPGKHGIRIQRGEFVFETDKFVLAKGKDVTLKVELLEGKVRISDDDKVIDEQAIPSPATVASAPDAVPFTPATKFALQFDGDDDQVTVPGIDWGRLENYTFETYVRVDRLSDRVGFVVNRYKNASLGFNTSNSNGSWILSFKYKDEAAPGYAYSSTPVELKKRVHLAGVAKGPRFSLFADGKLVGVGIAERELEPGLGESLTFGNRLSGAIDGIRISNIARYDKHFSPPAHFDNDPNTLAFYRFDEGLGDFLGDSSGRGHHGKIVGAKWVRADGSAIDLKSELANLKLSPVDKPWTLRTIAEWTIQRGGKVMLGKSVVSRVEDLPAAIGRIDLVDLGGVTTFTDADAALVATWPHVGGLSVADTKITDIGLRQLAKLKEMGSLNVPDTSITGEGFDAFERIPLNVLVLDGCRLSPEGWRLVSRVGKTKGWWLNKTNVDDARLGEIIGMHPEIELLSAPHNVLGDASAARLASLSNLKVLLLSRTKLTDKGLQKLESVKTLTRLEVAKTEVTAAGVARLQAALPNCQIDWDGATSPPVPAAAGQVDWTPLFNGRDLTGWQPMKTVGPQQDMHEPASGGWEVVDGTLVCATKEAGWLKSAQQYGDFELELEFKLPPDGNSDVFFRCPGTGRLSKTGLAAQIIDDGTSKTQLTDASRCGALWQIAGPKVSALRPLGEWNQMTLRCQGDHVLISVNGTTTADFQPLPDDRPRSGYLGLSNWYGEANGMAFRNLRIREMKPAAVPAPTK